MLKIDYFNDDNSLSETTIGDIKTNNAGYYEENMVKMSTKNFKKILSIIPRTTNGQMIQDTIQNIKDDLTELSFRPIHFRKDIIDLLKQIIDEQSFWNDLDELHELLSKDDKIPPFEGYPAERIGEINHP